MDVSFLDVILMNKILYTVIHKTKKERKREGEGREGYIDKEGQLQRMGNGDRQGLGEGKKRKSITLRMEFMYQAYLLSF